MYIGKILLLHKKFCMENIVRNLNAQKYFLTMKTFLNILIALKLKLGEHYIRNSIARVSKPYKD